MTRTCWKVLCISFALLTGLWAMPAHSQSSANYKLGWAVVDEGGGVRRSATYLVSHSLGAAVGATTTSASPHYTNAGGFYGNSAPESGVAENAPPVQELTYTITAHAGDGGGITPEGTVTIPARTDQVFTITPNPGYEIAQVLVDQSPATELTTITESDGNIIITKATVTFPTVTADHTLDATFTLIPASGSVVPTEWSDAEKSLANSADDWMCWAAAAANILDWAGWATPMFDSAQDVFYTFQNYWTNATGLMEDGWQWWFDGIAPEEQPGWAQVAPDGGNYWAGENFYDYFWEDWAAWDATAGVWSQGADLMAAIADDLQNDYGVTLAIYNGTSGHALTAWGYESDAGGNYTGVYVTDSDDYQTALKLLPVTLDTQNGLWYLGNEYTGWVIGGVEALAMNPEKSPIPEPGTLVLFVFGLLGLLALRRRRTLYKRK